MSAYLSFGDLLDLYYKIKWKGIRFLQPFINSTAQSRTISKWNTATHGTDFWVIPEVRQRWNALSTGHPDMSYEHYVMTHYFGYSRDLRMLSVGCGTGARERTFAQYAAIDHIDAIDVAPAQIAEADVIARQEGLHHIRYHLGDFTKYPFPKNAYDIILFNSSLHHFDQIDTLLQQYVAPLLQPNGYLIVFEYTGPNRLQWSDAQLAESNRLLRLLPDRLKTRWNSRTIKRRIYRPGILRMKWIDPSEAVDSSSIRPALHRHFDIVEEKNIGWDITQLLFKDIAHHFVTHDPEAKTWLAEIFNAEDAFIAKRGQSDGLFGMYRLRDSKTPE